MTVILKNDLNHSDDFCFILRHHSHWQSGSSKNQVRLVQGPLSKLNSSSSSTPSRSLQVGATRGRQKPMPEGPPVKGNLMHFDQTETAHFSQMVGLLNFFWGKLSFYWLSSLKLLKMIFFDFTSQLNWKQTLKMPVFTLFSSSKKHFLKNMYTPEMDVSCLNRSQLC